MKQFVTSLFQDKDGSISSKRMICFALVFTFIFDCFFDMFTRHSMNPALVASLVPLIYYSLGLVFGENVTNIFNKDKKDEKNEQSITPNK